MKNLKIIIILLLACFYAKGQQNNNGTLFPRVVVTAGGLVVKDSTIYFIGSGDSLRGHLINHKFYWDGDGEVDSMIFNIPVNFAAGSSGGGGGSGTVTSVSAGYGMNFTTITTSGSAIVDTSVLVNKTGTQTLTNKSISGASNTITNIPNASLTNSSITINGASVSLGSTRTMGLIDTIYKNVTRDSIKIHNSYGQTYAIKDSIGSGGSSPTGPPWAMQFRNNATGTFYGSNYYYLNGDTSLQANNVIRAAGGIEARGTVTLVNNFSGVYLSDGSVGDESGLVAEINDGVIAAYYEPEGDYGFANRRIISDNYNGFTKILGNNYGPQLLVDDVGYTTIGDLDSNYNGEIIRFDPQGETVSSNFGSIAWNNLYNWNMQSVTYNEGIGIFSFDDVNKTWTIGDGEGTVHNTKTIWDDNNQVISSYTDNFIVRGIRYDQGLLQISDIGRYIRMGDWEGNNNSTYVDVDDDNQEITLNGVLNFPFYGGWLSVNSGVLSGTSILNGQIAFSNSGQPGGSSNFNWDNSNSRLGIGSASPQSDLFISHSGLGVTQSDSKGIILTNPTSATAGNQQISLAVVQYAQGWKTASTAASQLVAFRNYVLPVQGTNNPTGKWVVESNVNSAGYVNRFTVTTDGQVGINNATPTAMLDLPAGTATAGTAPLHFTSGTNLTTPVAGSLEYNGTNFLATPSGTTRKTIQCSQVSRVTAQTGASASVATWTVGGSDGSFEVSANVLITTSTLHSFTVTCAYTDEGNTARTLTLNFDNLAGTSITTIANAAGAVPYAGVPAHIRCKSGTAITIATTGTFTTVTYNAEGSITQIN